MKPLRFCSTIFLFTSLLFAQSPDWPSYRGPSLNGSSTETGVFEPGKSYSLKTIWKIPLGSGYSSVSIANDMAVTAYSDSVRDHVVAFDALQGERLWQFDLDSTYKGHDGSHDGPIATPLIYKERVYAISPYGNMAAIDKMGKPIWQRNLPTDFEAVKPFYGFSSSPIISSGVLVLEVGGKNGKAIAGMNPDNGEILWTLGTDTIAYQSPSILKISGKDLLFAGGMKHLYALDAKKGELIWDYVFGGDGRAIGSGSTSPLSVGNNRFFIKQAHASKLVEITEENGEYASTEVWSNRNIRDTYNLPIYHNGHIYGYSKRFLTCLNAETGDAVWKSRQPGDGFISLVDGHLLILTKKGTLHIAPASSEGYNETARLDIFKNHAWSPPSFANGRIYVRSHGEIASVLAIDESQPAETVMAEKTSGSKFMKFVDKLEKAKDKDELINQFFSNNTEFPLIENDTLVHFVYRGEANDVAIFADFLGNRTEEPMKKIAGTDMFYYSRSLEPDAWIQYGYIIDYEGQQIDSLNKNMHGSVNGPRSWVALPSWKPAWYLEEQSDTPLGTMDSLVVNSSIIEKPRTLDIYLPPGYADSDKRYPTAYIHWGELAQQMGSMKNALDQLIHTRISPIIVVFIPQFPQNRTEFLGPDVEKYAEMVATEIVPLIDEKYRTIADPAQRANIGMGFAGHSAIYGTIKHSDQFGKMGSISAFMMTSSRDQVLAHLKAAEATPMQIYLDWGKYDMHCVAEQWDARRENQLVLKGLMENGYKPTHVVHNQGFSWIGWRNRYEKMLSTFFPKAQKM